MPHNAYRMGSKRSQTVRRNLALCFTSSLYDRFCIYTSIQLVDHGHLLFTLCHSSIALYNSQIIPGAADLRVPASQQVDQSGYVYGHSVNDIFLFMKKIVLASQSPRRKMLLEWAEVEFEVRVTETDESFPTGMDTRQVPVHISKNKASAIAASSNEIVLAADTIVVLDGEVIGKPKNRDEASQILHKLSGRTHEVITGVVIRKGEREISFSDVTEVSFHSLSTEQIDFYVDKYRPYDKAGAYAIQEWIGVVGIKGIAGDFYNVMGLPVSRVVKSLRDFD
jgi:septum formation protein